MYTFTVHPFCTKQFYSWFSTLTKPEACFFDLSKVFNPNDNNNTSVSGLTRDGDFSNFPDGSWSSDDDMGLGSTGVGVYRIFGGG